MPNKTLKEQAAKFKQDLYDQGCLDISFALEERWYGENPKCLENRINTSFNNSAQCVVEAEKALKKQPIDFEKLESRIGEVWKANDSNGAKKVQELCDIIKICCRERNAAGCLSALQELKTEQTTLQGQLRTYFELLERANADDSSSSSDDQKE